MNRNRKLQGLFIVALLVAAWVHVELQPIHSKERSEASPASEWIEVRDHTTPRKLTIWAPHANMLTWEMESFKAQRPNVSIDIVSWEGEHKLTERYLDALAADMAPDIMIFSHRMLGSLNSTDKLADLSQSTIPLQAFRSEMGEYLWSIHHSIEGKRMISIPFEVHPQVLYYRADLVKQAGFPEEPEELAELLEKPVNWTKLAEQLKKDKRWTLQWPQDLISTLNTGTFIFNRSLDYQRSSPFYERALTTSLLSKDYAANVSIYSPVGQQFIREGKLAMFMMPDWGESHLKEWAPEQAGLWRATRLPLNGYGIDIDSSKSIGITKQSKDKALAADFLTYVMANSGSYHWFKNTGPSPYLGQQHAAKLFWRVVQDQPADTLPTPLDQKAFQIWNATVDAAFIRDEQPGRALKDVKGNIMDALGVPQQQLKEYLKIE